jgi:cytoskeletal protein RodZ
VRAFIREYASFVGLDPAEIMKRYDQAKTEQAAPVTAEEQPPAEPIHRPEENKKSEESAQSSPTLLTPVVARFALPGILVLVLAIVIWNLTRSRAPQATNEVPFEKMTQVAASDSTVHTPVARHSGTPATPDSLTLRATVSDSAWVQIVIDNLEPQQYLFRPNRKIIWKARDRFRLSTGNAGAIDLTLNEQHLGAPGKHGAVLRNAEFNRQTLKHK